MDEVDEFVEVVGFLHGRSRGEGNGCSVAADCKARRAAWQPFMCGENKCWLLSKVCYDASSLRFEPVSAVSVCHFLFG
jgi:hypothetical protein